MLPQVYRGILTDGTEAGSSVKLPDTEMCRQVAVKVQRPGLAELVGAGRA